MKVFLVVTGQTFGADQVILEQVKNLGWSSTWKVEITRNLQECDFIIVFCPIMSRVGSDVEAAMREDSGNRKTLIVSNVQMILQLTFCLNMGSVSSAEHEHSVCGCFFYIYIYKYKRFQTGDESARYQGI